MGWLWHYRLAHVGMNNLHKLLKGDHVLGLTDVCFEKDRPCATCQAGKQVGSTHHSKNVMTTSRPQEPPHMDLFGPVAYLSIEGSKYGLVIVDDFFRFTWVFFLQDKAETQGALKHFLRRAQNEFELKVKKIRSDNGSEFKNLQVEEFLEEERHQARVLRSLHTTAKQCGREEEQDAYRYGENDAWRVQDTRAVLVGNCEHSLPRHKPALSASPPQEDLIRTPYR
jgi:transposase InsO family protein